MTRRQAGREAWHRLLDWDAGSTAAERLAAVLLGHIGFTDIDPSHPLGGPDGKKDVVVKLNDKRWIAAVYFPRGQRSFNEIKSKFLADAEGVARASADGFAFVTNQELSLAEREALGECATCEVELLHLERVAAVLNSPPCYGIRLEFLDIEMTKEEQLAHLAERDRVLLQLQKDLRATLDRLNTKPGERPAVVDMQPYDSGSWWITGRVLHFCRCGYGYFINTGLYRLTTLTIGGVSVTCPACGHVEYRRTGSPWEWQSP